MKNYFIKGNIININNNLCKISDNESIELLTLLNQCNIFNFYKNSILYFASGSQTAQYDFRITNIEKNYEVITVYTLGQIEE